MAKQGEIDYIQKIGVDGLQHARDKPFSDTACPVYLTDVGTILHLLPPPPARLLDLGAGSGWTSVFFALRGYEVVSQDIAPDMTALAQQNKGRYQLATLSFFTGDYEDLPYQDEFDCAVFYDALHHAEDEAAALAQIRKALKPGGLLVTLEPGEGHSQAPSSVEAMRLFGVTEKDMPPHHLLALGRDAGFRRIRVYPRPLPPTTIYATNLDQARVAPSRARRVKRLLRAAAHRLVRLARIGAEFEWPPLELRTTQVVVFEK